MIIFLFGPDTYRSREELRKIIEEYEKACLAGRQASLNWFNLVRIDAKDNAYSPSGSAPIREVEIFEQIRQSANTISMFNEKKLTVIENIFSAPTDIQKNILEFLKNKNTEKDQDVVLVFWAEDADEKSDLFNFLKTKAKCQEFEPLKGVQLRNWIKNYVSEQDGKIETQALDKLIEYIGNDLWRISNEINKLISYKSQISSTKSQTIEVEDVEMLVRPEIDLNIFDMIDALGQKNKARVLKLFNQHIEKGEDEFYLLSMFVYQIRNLIRIKSTPLAKLDLHPFVIRKTQYQAKNFSFEDLKKIYYQLMTIDLEAKTGKTDIITALELFLARV